MDFDKLLQRFTSRAEKYLFRAALVFVVLLFVVQALFLEERDNILSFFDEKKHTKDDPSPKKVEEVMARNTVDPGREPMVKDDIKLILEIIPPQGKDPELLLVLNKKVKGVLKPGKSYIKVDTGDELAIKSESKFDFPVLVRIIEVHGDISSPTEGEFIWNFGEKEELTKVEH